MRNADDRFDFRDLFVLDLANNHQGDMRHAKNVIRGHAEVAKRHGVRAALKFQFRELDGFVHPTHKKKSDNKHIPRFLSTRLTTAQFAELRDEVRKAGLLAMCTPFDEDSVDTALAMDFDVLKVASCSGQDWPLLERIAASGKPVIFSTGGLEQSHVDDLVSFFDHRGVRIRDHALRFDLSGAQRALQSQQHLDVPRALSAPDHRLVDA